jgi:hypothetical protein
MPTLQPSIGTAMAQNMSNVHVAAPAAAPAPSASATAAPACGNAAGMEKSGPSASTIGEETDEESEHELTPEEQKNAEHVKKVEAVIAAAEAAGFTFGKSKWMAAETFFNYGLTGITFSRCMTPFHFLGNTYGSKSSAGVLKKIEPQFIPVARV